MNLRNLAYRRDTIHPKEVLPRFHKPDFLSLYGRAPSENPHATILNTALELWGGGYTQILERYGFHERENQAFSGHCHQITPILGLVLKARGFPEVSYLECMRVYSFDTKLQYPPHLETSDKREEFCSIGRIPYCCLEVRIGDELFYLSGKHVKPGGTHPDVLLTSRCYRPMVGVLTHPDDRFTSGIYLKVTPGDPVVWRKQTKKDHTVEFFRTFAHMQLEW